MLGSNLSGPSFSSTLSCRRSVGEFPKEIDYRGIHNSNDQQPALAAYLSRFAASGSDALGIPHGPRSRDSERGQRPRACPLRERNGGPGLGLLPALPPRAGASVRCGSGGRSGDLAVDGAMVLGSPTAGLGSVLLAMLLSRWIRSGS